MSDPENKPIRSPKLDAMLASIKLGVVLKRTKSGKMTVENTKEREKRERSSDPALQAMLRQSNADRAKWGKNGVPPEAYRGWLHLAHAPLLQRQCCRNCGDVQVNVVAEMLHVKESLAHTKLETGGYRPPTHAWIKRSTTEYLPHEPPLWQDDLSVSFCYLCLQEPIEHDTQVLLNPEQLGQLNLID